MRRTTDATIREIQCSPWRGIPAKTIFFGGGTPTYLPVEQLTELLNAVLECHPSSAPDIEVTSEANPGTVDAEKFEAMRAAGFNRISLGAQSFLDSDLISLGRIHRAGEIERAVNSARSAGFQNLNVDLMFALPGQSLRAWEANLDRALGLGTDHLSLYGLTLEPNTPFYKRHLKGQLVLPEEEEQVRMYDLAVSKTAAAGLGQYEISNFAKSGLECKHNLCYWHNEYYAAYGPGAVGFMPSEGRPRRYTNLKHPDRYCDAVETGESVFFEEELLRLEDARMEKIMLGLRLNEGVPLVDLDLSETRLLDLTSRGWIERDQHRLRLTQAGRHFCSEVVLELV